MMENLCKLDSKSYSVVFVVLLMAVAKKKKVSCPMCKMQPPIDCNHCLFELGVY